ncbi:EAL domain-containing protein [Pseudoduganella namucuonensis]|uniref:PAS domain S-box-containing protein/diguanylate cyclase (GGDEF) domain-containing protein n=1 Tax=Pseudoduganella namucuonensis TaxID=1035707 RepID=A0A1I7M0Y9_9BURK|nr:EAL domain-containing protein [Pseudoduganella namucuonensis]SFV15631.1 PAS domain S-box-containing protein/diguanylate cyclase (GGDEF) domain-containing protein [Pseudoduganella namucuonensis]
MAQPVITPPPHEAAELFRLMAEEIRECAIFLLDTRGRITVWNRGAEVMKGYTAQEAIGHHFRMLYTEEDRARRWPEHNLRAAHRDGYYSEERWRRKKDGTLFWAHIALTALRGEHGALRGYSKVTLDLTPHKELERCLDERAENQRILAAAQAGTWEWDPVDGLLRLSPALLELLGYEENELGPHFRDWAALVAREDLPELRARLRRVAEQAPYAPLALHARLCRKDGRCHWHDIRASWCHSSRAGRALLQGVCVDIDRQMRLQMALRSAKERAQVTLRAITNGVLTTCRDGRIDTMNAAAEHLTGWMEDEVRGRPAAEVLRLADEASGAALPDPVARSMAERRVLVSPAPALLAARGGARHTVEYAVAPLLPPGREVDGAVVVLNDVSEAHGLLRSLRHQASHDALTGLVNRQEFGLRLQRALERSTQEGAGCALLYMDLDRFKIVNDTCGHAAGDDLLRQLAAAYSAHVRERDTLARLGGDEFALIVEHCTVQEALLVARKILDTTRAFRFVHGKQSFRIGVSIGLVPLQEVAQSAQETLRQADHACYIAKERGRNRVFVQRRPGGEMRQRRNDMYWAKRLGDAFRGDLLQLYRQPIHALGAADGGLHYEILLRLRDGPNTPIQPGVFLPAAERYDIMPEVDRWVLNKSLEWLERNPAHVARLALCTINLSQRALADPAFLRHATARVRDAGVPADRLCFEITETGAVANMRQTQAFIAALKELGCRFALDDFGTGLASFAYLKELPVDYVKIDGSFIEPMMDSTVDFEMVRFTNEISHIMGRRTIAEFVNDQATLARLTEIGVDFAQGYMLGEPGPLTA